jgi:hypothetical protein
MFRNGSTRLLPHLIRKYNYDFNFKHSILYDTIFIKY